MDVTDQAPLVAHVHEQVDHVRGKAEAPVILEYGDYECPYSRQAFRAIERVERELSGHVRFAFRHFPLTQIHPHALAAAAEAAARQDRFWEMHDLLYHRQKALEDDDLRSYAAELGLDLERFDADRDSDPVLRRVTRDLSGGIASGQILETPTLFIDGARHDGGYDAPSLIDALTGR